MYVCRCELVDSKKEAQRGEIWIWCHLGSQLACTNESPGKPFEGKLVMEGLSLVFAQQGLQECLQDVHLRAVWR